MKVRTSVTIITNKWIYPFPDPLVRRSSRKKSASNNGQALTVGALQLEGQLRLPAGEFLRGRPLPVGSLLE